MLILCFSSMANVSLALCPGARMQISAGISSFCIDNDCSKLPTDHQISHCGTKTEFPAHFFNLMTHNLNDTYKLICAKMRFCW